MTAAPLDATRLLGLWEATGAEPASRRADTLLRGAGLAEPASLGASNAQLAALHAQWFGPSIELVSHCPACAGAAEFSADASALAAELAPPSGTAPQQLECDGHALQFRLPRPDDVAAAAGGAASDAAFARQLAERCIIACTHGGTALPAAALPDAVLDAVSQRLEALDPGAELSFALECPHCAAAWSAPLDLGELLWRKLRDAAERLLLEVDALARAYGWSEPEILALSPLRRAAYLQMAAG